MTGTDKRNATGAESRNRKQNAGGPGDDEGGEDRSGQEEGKKDEGGGDGGSNLQWRRRLKWQ